MSTDEKLSLTLSAHLSTPKETRLFQGVQVPWEMFDYSEEFRVAERQGGLFDLTDLGVVQLQGKDAQDYLQRMTTVQFKTLGQNQLVHGAFLNGRAGVIALGVFRKVDDQTFHFIVSQEKKDRVLEHIEQFHFGEQFVVSDLTSQFSVFGLWLNSEIQVKSFGFEKLVNPLDACCIGSDQSSLAAWKDVRRPQLFWVVVETRQAISFIKKGLEYGLKQLGRRLFEFFRLEAGVPWAGDELRETDIILEGGFDEAVARNKGCYPGQEVVERIFTYGQVNRKLQRVTLTGEIPPVLKLPILFFSQGKEVGTLVSCSNNPLVEKTGTGLMYVRKEFWSKRDQWESSENMKAQLKV